MAVPISSVLPDDPRAMAREPQRDARSVCILAKTIYRELRQNGLTEQDVMALAGELLSLVTTDVEDRRLGQARDVEPGPEAPRSWPHLIAAARVGDQDAR